jgi:hypothetical protein
VAELLAEPDGGVPFAPVAKALAALRGVPCDEAFTFRASIAVYLLPEVADPDGANEVCRDTNVSLFLPMSMPVPDGIGFEFEARDAAGERVWWHRLDGEPPDLEDLRLARKTVKVPARDLANGAYELTVRTLVGGEPVGAADPVLTWRFHVLRGYQQRTERAFEVASERLSELSPEERPLLEGLLSEVGRAYRGEAFDARSEAVVDLQRLERALQNVANEEPVLTGLHGDVPVFLPTGEPSGLPCVLRLPADFEPGGARARRPMVVFAASSPSYDGATRRPTAPGTRGPRWLAHELPGFGDSQGWDVAFVDSPGDGRDYGSHLPRALQALRAILAPGDRSMVLVCDREAAAVAAFRIGELREHLAGLVLVGAGAMTGQALDELGELPVRYVVSHGYPAAEGMRRSLDYVDLKEQAGEAHGDVALLVEREMPWTCAVPLLADEIAAFAAEAFARRSR